MKILSTALMLFLVVSSSKLACRESRISLLNDWKKNTILNTESRKPARTAVLIIAPTQMGHCFVENRWRIGQKAWEQYMNSHPNVDCYFLKTTNTRTGKDSSEQVWLEGNTIYVGDPWYDKHGTDRILHKTIVAMELLLPDYTHFIRTNLNVFLNLKNVNEYMETHHQSFYTTPIWQSSWYTIGYSIIYTTDVAAHMVSEYRRLEQMGEELIRPNHSDDGALTSLATGVWPYDKVHPFRCCPTLPFGIRQIMSQKTLASNRLSEYGVLLTPPIKLKTALKYCDLGESSVMLYRTNGGLDLDELAQLYEHLMSINYPELPCNDLKEFVRNLQKD